MTEDDIALAAAMDRIALALHGDPSAERARLGQLTLRPLQLAARGRLLEILASYRGALLADAVGLGKTYVALAVAAEYANVAIVCPAALRDMWRRACAMSGARASIMSIEALSRGDRPEGSTDLIVIDEAHHLRTPTTRRYAAVAELSRRARLLLLSATPIQNSRRDIASLVALFAGSAAMDWTDAELARVVVRRDAALSELELPAFDGPNALQPGFDDDCLQMLLDLPPAVPASDEGVAHTLATISLIHLWSSSRAALVASLRKRAARAIALAGTLDEGRLPSQSELRAWTYGDDAMQMAFSFCASATDRPDLADLKVQVDKHRAGIDRVLAYARTSPNPDQDRVRLLQLLMDRHAGERIVAFSQYATTISAFVGLLRTLPGIASVTGDSARIASGAIPRDQILAQFAGDAAVEPPLTSIRLLLTTDLLSEGVDLRGASVIVNLDLPWNPARLEQRLGRARRLGSKFSRIHGYTLLPPTAAEKMLALRRRLASKVAIANAVVGNAVDPFDETENMNESAVGRAEDLRSRLASWIRPEWRVTDDAVPAASAWSHANGWLALVSLDGTFVLAQCVDGIVSCDEYDLSLTIESLVAAPRCGEGLESETRLSIDMWMRSRALTTDLLDRDGSSAKRAVLDRLSMTVALVPRHRQATAIASAQRARAALSRVGGIGAEKVMQDLARSTTDPESWIRAVEAFGATQIKRRPEEHSLLAMVVLRRQPPG